MAGGVLPPPWRMERDAMRRNGFCIIEGSTEEAVRELWEDCPPPLGLWDHPPVVVIGRENRVVR